MEIEAAGAEETAVEEWMAEEEMGETGGDEALRLKLGGSRQQSG